MTKGKKESTAQGWYNYFAKALAKKDPVVLADAASAAAAVAVGKEAGPVEIDELSEKVKGSLDRLIASRKPVAKAAEKAVDDHKKGKSASEVLSGFFRRVGEIFSSVGKSISSFFERLSKRGAAHQALVGKKSTADSVSRKKDSTLMKGVEDAVKGLRRAFKGKSPLSNKPPVERKAGLKR